jgi:hypothetical protein
MENRKERETRQFKRKKNNNGRKRREQKWSSFY